MNLRPRPLFPRDRFTIYSPSDHLKKVEVTQYVKLNIKCKKLDLGPVEISLGVLGGLGLRYILIGSKFMNKHQLLRRMADLLESEERVLALRSASSKGMLNNFPTQNGTFHGLFNCFIITIVARTDIQIAAYKKSDNIAREKESRIASWLANVNCSDPLTQSLPLISGWADQASLVSSQDSRDFSDEKTLVNQCSTRASSVQSLTSSRPIKLGRSSIVGLKPKLEGFQSKDFCQPEFYTSELID